MHNAKNWRFVGRETTGQCAAIIYTLVECARRHAHDPEIHLADTMPGASALSIPGASNLPYYLHFRESNLLDALALLRSNAEF